jgi:hypothetical protein
MGEPGYLVVANIPYYITSALIRHLLEARLKPARLVPPDLALCPLDPRQAVLP